MGSAGGTANIDVADGQLTTSRSEIGGLTVTFAPVPAKNTLNLQTERRIRNVEAGLELSKDVVMNNSPESTATGIVPVLSISPMEEDHFFLQNILNHLQGTLDPSRTSAI
jgi:hypothetical protein